LCNATLLLLCWQVTTGWCVLAVARLLRVTVSQRVGGPRDCAFSSYSFAQTLTVTVLPNTSQGSVPYRVAAAVRAGDNWQGLAVAVAVAVLQGSFERMEGHKPVND
jgi:hypothetical protein